jgi:hypothetical protein
MKILKPSTVAGALILGSAASLFAQTFSSPAGSRMPVSSLDHLEGQDSKSFHSKRAPGSFDIQSTGILPGAPSDKSAYAYVPQESNLNTRVNSPRSLGSVVDLDALRNPSPFRRSSIEAGTSSIEAKANDLAGDLALISAAYRAPQEKVSDGNCAPLSRKQFWRL